MRILQITSNDAKTGGAIAVTRLHGALQKRGCTSNILSFSDSSESNGVKRIERSVLWRTLDGIARRGSQALSLPYVFKPSFPLIWRIINEFQPHVIHLHWTYPHGLPLSMLPALTHRYPLVWTLHDMYSLTGGCTNSLGCMRWQEGCGKCPQLSDTPITSMLPLQHDTTALLWAVKRFCYRRSSFSVIAPSRWISNLARQSPLLKAKKVYHVANCLDTDFWRPLDKMACRQALDIPQDSFVLLFVGKPDRVFAYPGRSSVLELILADLKNRMPNLACRTTLLLVGEGGQEFKSNGFRLTRVGRVSSPAMLRICYNAADLLLDPTQFDNLPGIIQEAMACGTPVVASNVGGVPEMVRESETGYLSRRDAPQEFAEGVIALLSDHALWLRLSRRARQVAVEEYGDRGIGKQMIDIYEDEIERRA